MQAEGIGRRERERLRASGDLTRVARGWYGLPGYDREVAAALAAGGRLTCASALALHGVWVSPTRKPHIRITPGVAVPSLDCVPHRIPGRFRGILPIDDVEDALRTALGCLSAREFLIAAESAIRLGAVAETVVHELASRAPRQVRRALTLLDARSESGTETFVRFELQRRGHRVEPQFNIRAGEFVDLLVDGWLLIECDSIQHHTSAAAYANDRRRDLESLADGYPTVRLTYAHVMYQWEHTWTLLERVLARGARAGGRRPRRSHAPRAVTFRMSTRIVQRPGRSLRAA